MNDQHNNIIKESLSDYVKGKSLKDIDRFKFDSFFNDKYFENKQTFSDMLELVITEYLSFLGPNIIYYTKKEMKTFLHDIIDEELDYYDDEWEPI